MKAGPVFALVAGAVAQMSDMDMMSGMDMPSSTLTTLSTSIMAPSVFANVTVVTLTATAFTTVCPEPTVFTYNSNTYTVVEPTTITIPCGKCQVVQTIPCEPTPTPISTGTGVPWMPGQPPVQGAPPASGQDGTPVVPPPPIVTAGAAPIAAALLKLALGLCAAASLALAL